MKKTIRLEFYMSHSDLPAFDTVEEAKNSEFVPPADYYPKGYAVVFELDGAYAVYVHSEDRYYSSYLPFNAKVLWGGWWEKGKTVDWQQIGNFSQAEIDLLKENGLDHLLDN